MYSQNLRPFVPTQGEQLWSKSQQKATIYKEYMPSIELQPYIACYWYSKTIHLNEKPSYNRVIPDGCMDIVFNIKEIEQGKCGIVTGLMTVPEEEKTEGIREFVGIRFWPGGMIPLIKSSAYSFTDKHIPLDYVLGRIASNISEKIYFANTFENRKIIMEEELKKMISNSFGMDLSIKNTLHLFYKHKGIIPIRDIAKELNISQRHLSRKFKDWIGTNPKTFSKILRFQNSVNQLNDTSKRNLMDIAINNGYYDQAHFIRDFKLFYGTTPGKL